jgi:diphthamide biosynthesis protein 7
MSALPSSAISSASTATVYSADSVEFSPFNPSIFVVGTYQIEKDPIVPPPAVVKDGTDKDADDDSSDEEDAFEPSPTITRYGRCLLYEIDPDGTNL